MRKIGKILKYAVIAFVLVIIALMIFRIMMQSDTRTLSEIIPTDGLASAYISEGDSAFLYQKPRDEIASDGYYTAYAFIYSPESEEVQLTARYNDSLYERYLNVPSDTEFLWELRNSDGDVISSGKPLAAEKKYFYNYVRLSFENVRIDEDSDDVYLYLICPDADYPDSSAKGMHIRSAGTAFKAYKLSKAEKAALNDYKS